jgi:hypothetical protein
MTIKEALKGVQRAIVWATDLKSGKRLEASWVFKIPEPAPPPAAVPAATPPTGGPCVPTEAVPCPAPATVAPAVPVASGGGSH